MIADFFSIVAVYVIVRLMEIFKRDDLKDWERVCLIVALVMVLLFTVSMVIGMFSGSVTIPVPK